jgi:very-short-patch-repair endonuclease
MLDPQERPDVVEQNAIMKEVSEIGDFLWDGTGVQSVLKSWVHAVSAQGLYEDTLKRQAMSGDTPIVHLAPAVILRRRSERSIIKVLTDIIDQLRNGMPVPEGVTRIVRIFDESVPNIQDDHEKTQHKHDASPEEVYFPLEVNEEQLQIVRSLALRNGILVQGPPGTGKSHTIANLVCHLLAHGKRVLITSHTARALRVLKEKIPEGISQLSVILLGDDVAAMDSLENSVRGITTRYNSWDERSNQKLIKKLKESIDKYRRLEATTINDLRAVRERETFRHPPMFGGYEGTAQAIAIRVKEEESLYGWMSAQPEESDPVPLSNSEATTLLRLMRKIDKDRERELQRFLPELKSLPDPDHFAQMVRREKRAFNLYKRTAKDREHPEFSALAKVRTDRRKTLLEGILDLLDTYHTLVNYAQPWIKKAANQIIAGQDQSWRKLLAAAREHLDAIGDRANHFTGVKVSGLEGRDKSIVKLHAANLVQHLNDDGKLGFGPFRAKAVKEAMYLIREVRINGHLCDELQYLRELVEWLEVSEHLELLEQYWTPHIEPPSGPFDTQVAEYGDLCKLLEMALRLHQKVNALRQEIRVMPGVSEPEWHDLEQLRSLVKALQAILIERNLVAVRAEFEEIENELRSIVGKPDAHEIASQFLEAIKERNEEHYAESWRRTKDLIKLRDELGQQQGLLNKLRDSAPNLCLELIRVHTDSIWDDRMTNFSAAWNWACANRWLQKLDDPGIYDQLTSSLDSCRSRLRKLIANLAEAKAWHYCFSRLDESQRQHLMAWTKAVQRIGKGKGKYAPLHRREARKHMDECRSSIPAWIMPIFRVAETVRPGRDAFDVVIIDEASQSGPEALFLNYLAEKILVVGDDKQISPEFIGVNREDVELLRQRYIADIPHSDALGVDTSFFELAEIRYGGRIRLREHFRCMPEIIQFSNNLCYRTEPLIPLRQYGPGRLSPVIITRHVTDGYQKGSSPRTVNPPEAEAIVDQIEQCCEDPAYEGKTVGVISLLGQDQARLIETTLLERIGPEEMEKRHLVCGDPYAFQGDERDVIFFSLVSAPTEGQRIGTLASKRDERRFNVAASRAKDQMWLFHSVTLNDLSPACFRYQLLDYCQNPKVEPITFAGLEIAKLKEMSRNADRARVPPPDPFDSWFELDVFLRISDRGYRVIPQFEVAGYFIDLVVEGIRGRLAVECDGDEWHGLERYEQDQARQRQLERCGWVFWRVRGSSFYRELEAGLKGLWEVLDRLGIYPQSGESENLGAGKNSGEEEESSLDSDEAIEEDRKGADFQPGEKGLRPDKNAPPSNNFKANKNAVESPVQAQLFPKVRKSEDKKDLDSKSKQRGGARSTESRVKNEAQKRGTMGKIDPRELIDPLQEMIFNLLPIREWNCEKCGRTRQVLIGPFGPYLKCTNPKCKKTKRIAFRVLDEAFRVLQVPCKGCGSPVEVIIGKNGWPMVRCSRHECKSTESWGDLNERIKRQEVRLQLGEKRKQL